MARNRRSSNRFENGLVKSLDDKNLAAMFLPAIKEVVKAGGGAEAILKKSEAMAALGIVESAATSKKDDVRLKAQIEILNRTQGKPVERKLSIYGDIADMTPEQVENDIINIVSKAKEGEIMKMLTEGKKVRRKPRTVELVDDDGTD